MKIVIKLIWKNIPRYSKIIIGTITSVFIGNYLLPSLFNWKPPVLPDGLLPSLLITLGLILISIFISLFITVYKLIHELNTNENKKPSAYIIEPIKKNKLPDYLDLKTEILNGIQYNVKIVRCFYPDDKAGMEKFLEVIRIKNVLCSECKSDISRQFNQDRRFYVYTCSNKICKNHMKQGFTDLQYKDFLVQFLTQAKSEIRQDFNKYWDIYLKDYKTLTDGKYEEYYEPITFYDAKKYY